MLTLETECHGRSVLPLFHIRRCYGGRKKSCFLQWVQILNRAELDVKTNSCPLVLHYRWLQTWLGCSHNLITNSKSEKYGRPGNFIQGSDFILSRHRRSTLSVLRSWILGSYRRPSDGYEHQFYLLLMEVDAKAVAQVS